METLLGILGIILFILIIFIIPAIIIISSITFAGAVAGFLSGVIGTRLFSKLPNVENFFNRVTELFTGNQKAQNGRPSPKVVGIILIFYGVVFSLLYLPIVMTLEDIGYSLFNSFPDGYLSAITYLYPIYMLIFSVPFFLSFHYLITQEYRGSLPRVSMEWATFLFVVNVLIVFSVLLSFQLLGFIYSLIFRGFNVSWVVRKLLALTTSPVDIALSWGTGDIMDLSVKGGLYSINLETGF